MDTTSRASNGSLPNAAVWHASAPEPVRTAAVWTSGSPGWKAWQNHLATRGVPTIDRLLESRSPLLWGAAALSVDQDNLDLIELLTRTAAGSRSAARNAAEQAVMWLRESSGTSQSEAGLLECLAWAHALPALARTSPAELWWELLDRLQRVVVPRGSERHATAWQQQVLQTELPLTLAWLFSEIGPCRNLSTDGTQRLLDSLSAAESSSLLDAKNFPHLRARLASWWRSLKIVEHCGTPLPECVKQSLGEVLSQALRFTCPSGRQALDRRQLADRSLELFAAILPEINNAALHTGAAVLIPAYVSPLPARRRVPTPSPAWHSEQAALGVLRRDWSTDGEMLAVRHSDRLVLSELTCGRRTLWSGHWNLQVRVDGQLLEQRSDWDTVCWVSDDDVDYLELEARFTGGVRVQRQMLLARQDRLLYLADVVLGQTKGQLDVLSALPLDTAVEVHAAEETREISLTAGRTCRVMPLALPEWQRDPRGGTLSVSDQKLQLAQQRVAKRLYVPLLVDLDPRRARQPLTWRQLTIAQDRQTVSGDTAVGYRVQIGRQQWLIYRALAERANRTLLGSNLVSEFMFARFSPEGEADPLLEIE